MNTIARCLVTLFTLGLATAATAELGELPSGSYTLDKTHGYITFSYSHLGFSNPHVGFNSFDVTLDLDAKTPNSSTINVVIDATSIDSRVEKFNGHLNGDDFFDTAKYPTIGFESTIIETNEDGTYSITGDLTIKDVTRPVTLEATIKKAANHPMLNIPAIGVGATAKLKRSDWDLGNYAPDVGDEVTLYIEVELQQKKGE